MPKQTFGIQLLLLVAVAGGCAWQSAGYFSNEVAAANAGAKAVATGSAFARKVIQA